MYRSYRSAVALSVVVALVGCASPAPSMIAPGVYMISRTSAAGSVMVNMAQLKADTIDAANKFAESRGKIAIAVSMRDERPIPGFPLVEYQFRLADPGTVGDSTVVLKKAPDTVIQRNDNVTIKSDQSTPREPQKDLYSELLKLEDLKKRGLLTEDEFQVQKQKLLAK
jgi:hypothetical protein